MSLPNNSNKALVMKKIFSVFVAVSFFCAIPIASPPKAAGPIPFGFMGAQELGSFPGFPGMVMRFSAGSEANTSTTITQNLSPSDVDTVNNKLILPDLGFQPAASVASIAAIPLYMSTTGVLPITSPQITTSTPLYLSPASGGGYDIYTSPQPNDWENLRAALPDERPLTAQNFLQRSNKVVLLSGGSGTHTLQSTKLLKKLIDIAGVFSTEYYFGNIGTDPHKYIPTVKNAGRDRVFSQILARDPDKNGTYNLYGSGWQNLGNAAEYSAARGNKRTAVMMSVLEWNETLAYGVAKAPVTFSGVNTSTGVITSTAHGLTTASATKVIVYPGGTLPTGFSSLSTYYVRSASSNTITLHPTALDATNNTNIIIPSTQGTLGFLVYTPEIATDVERYRFIAEVRNAAGGNTMTPRTNMQGSYGGRSMNMATSFVAGGSNSGDVGITGNSLTSLVPTDSDIAKVNIYYTSAATPPTRTDTGLTLSKGEYWINRKPGSNTFIRMFDSQSAATANLGVATASATNIKFSAVGSGTMLFKDSLRRSFAIGVERGDAPDVPGVWSPWQKGTGVLTTVTDYNDPASPTIRNRVFWNTTKIADYLSSGAKGNTDVGTSTITFVNSSQGHVPFEGYIDEFILGFSDNEVTDADLLPAQQWLVNKYGIQ